MKKATGGSSSKGRIVGGPGAGAKGSLKVTTTAGLNKAYRDQAKKRGAEGPKKSQGSQLRGGPAKKSTSASRKTAEAKRIPQYAKNQAKLAKKVGKRDR